MDPTRFDTLTRSLSTTGSRRRALSGLLAGTLGVLGRHDGDESAAHDLKAKCKKKSGEAKKKCLKKAKKHAASHETPPPPPPPMCGAGGPCLVFLSSTRHTGNLGGLSGGDAICQRLAAAAGLPGTYKAWLSDSTSSVSSRFVPSPGPYRLVNGTTIAANWADLLDGNLAAPIGVTETGGGDGGNHLVWTGTLPNGNASSSASPPAHCSNWSAAANDSGRAGFCDRNSSEWTAVGTAGCAGFNHLYCFQHR